MLAPDGRSGWGGTKFPQRHHQRPHRSTRETALTVPWPGQVEGSSTKSAPVGAEYVSPGRESGVYPKRDKATEGGNCARPTLTYYNLLPPVLRDLAVH